MPNRLSSYVFAGLLALILTAGQAFGQQPGEQEIRQGVIEQITQLDIPTTSTAGLAPSSAAWAVSESGA